jgi:hypothetical protein
MYSFAENIDLAPLIGSEIEQVCVGMFDLQLRLSARIGITAYETIRVERGSESHIWRKGDPTTGSHFTQLVGCRILRSRRIDESLLHIYLSKDFTLELRDDLKEYETFTITWPGVTIVV